MNVIVIDVETTGLDTETAQIIEVAAMDLRDPDKRMYFVPNLNFIVPVTDGPGLQVNRYFERGAWRAMLSESETHDRYLELWEMLEGNTIAGSNPRFDANVLARKFRMMGLDEPWHHRLFDVSAYAAGVFGTDSMYGLAGLCDEFGINTSKEHSAMGDVENTRECILELEKFRSRFIPAS